MALLTAACSKSESPTATATADPSEARTIAIRGTPQPVASAPAKLGASAKTDALEPASTHLSGKNFTLDVASPGCRVDQPCAVTLRLVAAGDFHVNKEYPYKFTAAAAPGVQFLGSGDANTFTRAAGDFREDSEKTGTMTVRFKPTSAGEARVEGTYKLSVCSAAQCQIETQAVQLAVPVM